MENGFKTKNICIRVSEEEYVKINKYAAEFNLPTGTYMRLIALLGYLPYRATRSTQVVSESPRKVTAVRERYAEPNQVPALKKRLAQ